MKRKVFALLGLLIPALMPAKEITATASWYGAEYNGKKMANGERFDHRKPTVATYEFPLGTRVKIKYISRSGMERVVYAVVTDRGPSSLFRDQGRLFDFSWTLFKLLESPKKGLISVTVSEVKE